MFITNFNCDENICRWSHINISLSVSASNTFTTCRVDNYHTIQRLLLDEGAHSIRITCFILKSRIFQNTVLVYSLILIYFLVYRGKMTYIGIEFSQYIFLFHNTLFTILPLLYYIFFKPTTYEELIKNNYSPNDLLV